MWDLRSQENLHSKMYDLGKRFAAEMYLFGISMCYVCVVKSTLLNSVNVSGNRITLQVYVYFLFL